MQIVYSPEYEVNLGAHPFVTAKYRLVKEKLIEENIEEIKEENTEKTVAETVEENPQEDIEQSNEDTITRNPFSTNSDTTDKDGNGHKYF